jgi:hypothetical protein
LQSLNELGNNFTHVVVEFDAQYTVRVGRPLKHSLLQNGHVIPAECSHDHAHLKYDVLSRTRLPISFGLCLAVAIVIGSQQYYPECRFPINVLLKRFDDGFAARVCVLQNKGLEAEAAKHKLELIPRVPVVAMYDEDLGFGRSRRQNWCGGTDGTIQISLEARGIGSLKLQGTGLWPPV